MRKQKLTAALLKKIVVEELSKLQSTEDVDVEDVEADEYADVFEKHIDYIKTLKIEEAKLNKRLAKLSERKRTTLNKLISR